MKIRVINDPASIPEKCVFIAPALEDEGGLAPEAAAWLAKSADFGEVGPERSDCERGAVQMLAVRSGKKLLAAGLGRAEGRDANALRSAVASAVRSLGEGAATAFFLVPGFDAACSLSGAEAAREAAYAAELGGYRYHGLKTGEKKAGPQEFLISGGEDEKRAAKEGAAMAEGVILARDLVNAPGNVATPTHLAQAAQGVADRYGFSCEIMDRERILEEKMGAFASVFRGSFEEPRFVVLDTGGEGRPLVFVGKGVTFDTGGISLKPGKGMVEMKGDMAGAAAVIGLFEAAGRLDLPVRCVGLIPCTDNMPDGAATRPGDVVVSRSGKTVEIVNTDAEGRLLLIDALDYAGSFEPWAIIDVATLTGMCVVALGRKAAGLFSNSDSLRDRLEAAGGRAGELLWRMPLYEHMAKDLESDSADMQNAGRREGGALSAALFLSRFVPDGVDWAHLDIAGPGWSEEADGVVSKGGSGFSVRTLLELALEGTAE